VRGSNTDAIAGVSVISVPSSGGPIATFEARSQMVRRCPRWIVDRVSASQQKITNPLLGEAVISGLVSVFLLIGVVWSLPNSEIKRGLTPILRPIASAAGLDQSWRMFAPEPIRRLETVEVRVTMADRAERVMTLAGGGLVTESLSWYRWQKLKEQSVRRPASRAEIAHWVVIVLTDPAEHPVRVEMILRTELLPPPGKDGPTTPAVETLYDEALTGRS
jgi:hypothetical protein